MDVAAALLGRARAIGASSLAVVGTSKNAGKTVAIAALSDALGLRREGYALCSIGRDGEAADALDASPKPRFFLRAGAVIATAAALLPRTPACEILEVTRERGALGRIAIARVRAPGFFELAGPSSASALRRVVRALATVVPFVLIDGAIDRIAALRAAEDAIVVAVGAAGAATMERAVDDVAALVLRLRLPLADPGAAAVRIDGALTAAAAAAFVQAGEARQIVVADPTRIAFGGRTFLTLAARLDLRSDVALHPIACTVAPRSALRFFEPRAFAREVARRTGLPVYDVYAATESVA